MLQLLQFISAQSDAVKPGEIAILLFLSYFRFLLVLCWPLHSEELIGSAPSIAQYHHHLHRIAEKYFLALREPKNRVKDASPFLLCLPSFRLSCFYKDIVRVGIVRNRAWNWIRCNNKIKLLAPCWAAGCMSQDTRGQLPVILHYAAPPPPYLNGIHINIIWQKPK